MKQGGTRGGNGHHQEQIRVILKLFVVMGVTWLSEFLCFMFGWIFGQDVVWKYFVVNDILNLCQVRDPRERDERQKEADAGM